jgi:ABC-type branched-subunit amino acid transport system ATPase component
MLKLKDVHVHYGLSHVLQGVSIEVKAGEVVRLFGRNGVGKTTIMKTIAGWLTPSLGQVLFKDQSFNARVYAMPKSIKLRIKAQVARNLSAVPKLGRTSIAIRYHLVGW